MVAMVRKASYGEGYTPTRADRLGIGWSERKVRKEVKDFTGLDVGDIGCGFNAALTRRLLDEVKSATVVDVSLAEDLKSNPKIRAIEGELPGILSDLKDQSLDLIMCVSVLEHLWEPAPVLAEFHRILREGGVCIINVPSWRGKRFLELSAFRLHLSTASEMDDHKWYFDPKDLWPLLVRAGFVPHNIRCRRYKFGLNTIATCRTWPAH